MKSTSGGGVSVIPEGATEQELHELASAQAGSVGYLGRLQAAHLQDYSQVAWRFESHTQGEALPIHLVLSRRFTLIAAWPS